MTEVMHTPTRQIAGTPRLGFLGVGWIGRHRMRAIADSGAASIAALADPCRDAIESALPSAPGAMCADGLENLLEQDLDGIVIATPSAMHAGQAIAALERGVAVFCQKPLGRSAAETRAVVEAARRADRLLGVDFSYRLTAGFAAIQRLIRSGKLGEIYAADLVFHNAYGPDKPWFRDPALSGGGCVIDLGIHLVDLAMAALDRPEVVEVESHLLAGGAPLRDARTQVEDYASAMLRTKGGASVRLACSWNLPAGRDAVISAEFYGSRGGAVLRNVEGSFFDFRAERFRGTSRETLAEPPDAWCGRAAVAWAQRLGKSRAFDPSAMELVAVAEVVDRIYGR